MGMYDSAERMRREPATKAVSAKNAQPEPGKVEHGAEAEAGDEGFAHAMQEHHGHQASRHRAAATFHDKLAALHSKHATTHREEAEYHDGKAAEYK